VSLAAFEAARYDAPQKKILEQASDVDMQNALINACSLGGKKSGRAGDNARPDDGFYERSDWIAVMRDGRRYEEFLLDKPITDAVTLTL